MYYVLITPTVKLVKQYNRLYMHENMEADWHVQLFKGMEDVDIRDYVDFDKWNENDMKISGYVENKNMEDLFKTLNTNYHTHLNTKRIAEALETWDKLEHMTVDQFVAVCYEQTGKHAYSFATKVFNFINGKSYPILDSYVVTLLEQYLNASDKSHYNQDKKTMSKKDWDTYERYKSAYDTFRDKYQLTDLSYKETDVFLWAYGSAIQKYWKKIGVLSFESVSYKR